MENNDPRSDGFVDGPASPLDTPEPADPPLPSLKQPDQPSPGSPPPRPPRSPMATIMGPLADFAEQGANADARTRREAERMLDEIADGAIALANYRISKGANPETAGRYAADDLISALELDKLFPQLSPDADPSRQLMAAGDETATGKTKSDEIVPGAATEAAPDAPEIDPDEDETDEVDVDADEDEDEDETPDFEPDDVARAADLIRRLEIDSDPDPDPDLSERRDSARARRLGGERVDTSFEQVKAAATQAEKDLGELMLSMIPGLGELMSAGDAVTAFREAQRLEALGKLDEALEMRGEGSLGAFGAIPFIGRITRAPKIAGKFKRFFEGAGLGRAAPKSPSPFKSRPITNAEVEEVLTSPQFNLKRREDVRGVNRDLTKFYRERGSKNIEEPFDPTGPAGTIRKVQGLGDDLVQVYAEGAKGRSQWLMRKKDIEGLTLDEIKNRWGLPDGNTVDRIVDFVPDHDFAAEMIAGRAKKAFGKEGGGLQFKIEGDVPTGWFRNERGLPK